MDPIIELMLLLKNNWSLTGDLSVNNIMFSTRLYDENIQFPQIVLTPAGQMSSPPVDCGSSDATYLDLEAIGFNIYIRPKQDSNSSLGWAKNAMYSIRKEVELILKQKAVLTQDDDNITKFVILSGWSGLKLSAGLYKKFLGILKQSVPYHNPETIFYRYGL